jgi:hypothetical protein
MLKYYREIKSYILTLLDYSLQSLWSAVSGTIGIILIFVSNFLPLDIIKFSPIPFLIFAFFDANYRIYKDLLKKNSALEVNLKKYTNRKSKIKLCFENNKQKLVCDQGGIITELKEDKSEKTKFTQEQINKIKGHLDDYKKTFNQFSSPLIDLPYSLNPYEKTPNPYEVDYNNVVNVLKKSIINLRFKVYNEGNKPANNIKIVINIKGLQIIDEEFMEERYEGGWDLLHPHIPRIQNEYSEYIEGNTLVLELKNLQHFSSFIFDEHFLLLPEEQSLIELPYTIISDDENEHKSGVLTLEKGQDNIIVFNQKHEYEYFNKILRGFFNKNIEASDLAHNEF